MGIELQLAFSITPPTEPIISPYIIHCCYSDQGKKAMQEYLELGGRQKKWKHLTLAIIIGVLSSLQSKCKYCLSLFFSFFSLFISCSVLYCSASYTHLLRQSYFLPVRQFVDKLCFPP